jgi:hypothetical protein
VPLNARKVQETKNGESTCEERTNMCDELSDKKKAKKEKISTVQLSKWQNIQFCFLLVFKNNFLFIVYF